MGKRRNYKKINNIEFNNMKLVVTIASLAMLLLLLYFETFIIQDEKENSIINTTQEGNTIKSEKVSFINYNLENIPEYDGKIYIEMNNNIPYFNEEEITNEPFERYSELDEKGRCSVAFANICKEIMPKEGQKRESISKIKPTGWKQTMWEGEYLYNRCHLIAYQLADENANEKNLITGTRYFNIEGMLPFENKVANYIKKNANNHVLYRVTPYFKEYNMLASGVEIEAYSVEDSGNGVQFNIFIYNIQPGVILNYLTGEII